MTKYLLLPLLLISGLTSCGDDDDRGSGTLVTVDRTDGAFSAIVASNSYEVEIVRADVHRVTLTADDNLVERYTTTTANGVLTAGIRSGTSVRGETIRLRVETPALEAVTLSTSAEATVAGFETFGALAVDLSTSSQLAISGATPALTLRTSTSSTLDGYGLTAAACTVEMETSSEAEVTVTERLDGRVTTSAELRYRGRPTLGVVAETSGRVVDGN